MGARDAAAQRLSRPRARPRTDLSFFKDFRLPTAPRKLQFRAEAFNVFNRVNLQRPNGNMAQATFGRSTQSFPAREMQFALKFIF